MTHRPHRGAAAAGALALGSAVLALLPAQAGAATELLVNGGFESAALSPWTCAGTAATTTSAPHSGTAALTAAPGAADLAPCTQSVAVQRPPAPACPPPPGRTPPAGRSSPAPSPPARAPPGSPSR
ncbi:hypothetical protein ACFY00_08685 [Kitasatospora sp. NPDC001540]|uniref:hypothetical protein n=1 Tax=Kitasatospora sp. NPDC001540 TaxID=3364014 RepID=UPI0036768E81